MPVFVLDEGGARAESLLAVPLRARNRTLGALFLTGARGSFDTSSRRVLEILANQAAATIQLIKDKEQQRQLAVRDGLTGLYNRRAFGERLASTIANEDRRPDGSLGLVILDLDGLGEPIPPSGRAAHGLPGCVPRGGTRGRLPRRGAGATHTLILDRPSRGPPAGRHTRRCRRRTRPAAGRFRARCQRRWIARALPARGWRPANAPLAAARRSLDPCGTSCR